MLDRCPLMSTTLLLSTALLFACGADSDGDGGNSSGDSDGGGAAGSGAGTGGTGASGGSGSAGTSAAVDTDAGETALLDLSDCETCVASTVSGDAEDCAEAAGTCDENASCALLMECTVKEGCMTLEPADLMGCMTSCSAVADISGPSEPALAISIPLVNCVSTACADVCQ